MQHVEFKFGGLTRRITTPIGLALTIEANTGVGIMSLAHQLARGEARLAHAIEIIRAALDANKIAYTAEELLDQMQEYGSITDTMLAAAGIVNALFYKSPAVKGKSAGNGKAAPATATQSPIS